MALNKQDLIEIKKIVDVSIGNAIEKSETKMSARIEKSELKMSDKIEFIVEKSKDEIIAVIDKKIKDSEENIVTRINREVADLADINRAVIERGDESDCRLRIVERKLGVKA